MAQAAVHRAREASLRLAQILDKNRPAATRVWKPALGIVGVFSVVCLALLAHAPQFVAFDRGALNNNSDRAVGRSVSFPSSISAPVIIPAALRTGESSPAGTTDRGTTAKIIHARAHEHNVAAIQLAPARVVAVGSNAAAPRERVVEASASADQETVPEFRALVFVVDTQYMISDSAVWRVQVWRVILVSPVRDSLTGVPVAHSI
jgi:hypothetical protein